MKLARKKLNSILKKKKSDCVFAMKHGGLAAKLDVVHWPLLVDTERKGRAGKGDPETTSQSLPPRVQPRPSSSSSLTDCQLCQVHGGARMQGRIQEVPGFCFVPGERLHPAPSSEQRKGKHVKPVAPLCQCAAGQMKAGGATDKPCKAVKSPWPIHKLLPTHTARAHPSLPASPTSKEQSEPHLSGLLMVKHRKTLTNVTNAK